MEAQEFKELLQKTVTAEMIAEVVAGTISDIEAGKHKLSERVGAGYTVRDLRSVKGWWTLKPVLEDMVASAAGKFGMMLGEQVGFNTRKCPLATAIDILRVTEDAEKIAVVMVSVYLTETLGCPMPTPKEAEGLLKKVMASQEMAENMVTKRTLH